MDISKLDDRKARAKTWFESLRDDICAAFERLEDEAPAALYPGKAGRFERNEPRLSVIQIDNSALMRAAVSTSTASPASCPKVSFTRLKKSRSISSSVKGSE